MVLLYYLGMYKLVLDILYWQFVMPVYGADVLFDYGAFDFIRMLIGYLLLIPVCCVFNLLSRSDNHKVSRLVLVVQCLFVIVPSFTLLTQSQRNYSDTGLLLLGFFCVSGFVLIFPKLKLLAPSRIFNVLLVTLGFCLLCYVFLGLLMTGGLSRLNFNFYNVYEVRESYSESKLPLFGYLLSWVAYVINMGFLIYGVASRKRLLVLSVIFIQVMIFGMTNFKSFLFLPFVVLGVFWVVRRYNVERILILGACAVAILLTSVALTGEIMGLSIARRMFFVPSALHTLYFDYFSTHAPSLMSGSVIGDLISSPYRDSAVSIIADEYWGREFSPNVGWIGAAYASFAVYGVLLFSLLLALYLSLADNLARKIRLVGIPEALFIAPSVTLCGSAFNTFLLTHGGALVLVVLWVMTYSSSVNRSSTLSRVYQDK